MRKIKQLVLTILMMVSLNCFAQYNGDVRDYEMNINNLYFKIHNQTLLINIPSVEDKNIIRKVDIYGILDNCDEYCLNLNDKSEILVKNNKFMVTLPKTIGKYLIRVTFQVVTSDGIKKTFFEEKYFDII